MCGLVGVIDYSKTTIESSLRDMNLALSHRGPDDNGLYLKESARSVVGLGHTRLSIQDLSISGHQPMRFRSFVLVYNGEIYNFKAVRDELSGLGYGFESESDTEVLIKAFDAWGKACVDRFIGMFVFAIYCEKTSKLHIFRDRSGVKPLFYYWDGELFIFASELKAFHKHPRFRLLKAINKDSLSSYMLMGYIPSPGCIFENTYKLLPGNYLVIDTQNPATGALESHSYWDAFALLESDKVTTTKEELLESVENDLVRACKLRMVADVPVGVFLSGGYDSSLVAALIAKDMVGQLQTFTVGFESEDHDESVQARRIAVHLGTEHREFRCSDDDFLQAFELLPRVYDEPVADESALPTILLSQFASQYVKVAISADGGDELFAGYNKYRRMMQEYERLSSVPRLLQKAFVHGFPNSALPLNYRSKFLKLKQFFSLELQSPSCTNLLQVKHLKNSYEDVGSWIKDSGANPLTNIRKQSHVNSLGHILAADYYQNMSDAIVTKVERASMAFSLEAREPLLDHKLYELLARTPDDLRCKPGEQKSLLKEIAHRHIPRELLERPKQGFSPPLKQWVTSNQFQGLTDKFFSEDFIESQNLFTREFVSFVGSPRAREDVRFQYNFLVFQLWFSKWMR